MPAKYYQKNKQKLQKGAHEGIEIFLKKRKTKSVNMIVKCIKIFLKKKKKKKCQYYLKHHKNLPEDKK